MHNQKTRERIDWLNQLKIEIATYCCTTGSVIDNTKVIPGIIVALSGKANPSVAF